jgi:hypothetical protein
MVVIEELGLMCDGGDCPGKISPGHMVTGEPVNVSGGSHGWL